MKNHYSLFSCALHAFKKTPGMIKTGIAMLSLLFLLPGNTQAQRLEITPSAAWFIGGSLNYVQGRLRIQDAAEYGLSLGFRAQDAVVVELQYFRANTRANFTTYVGNIDSRSWQMAVNYFQVGVFHELADETVRPFLGGSFGTTWFENYGDGANINDVWRFSFTLGGGVKIFLTDRIGIRLQARMLLPVYFAGGGLFCGIGTGGSSCGVSLGAGASILQADFGAGLVISLGD